MTHRETVVRGKVSTRHLMQLFDSSESLTRAVSEYVREGLAAGDTVFALMTTGHWSAVGDRLRAGGAPVDAALHSGQLTVGDAAQALTSCMRRGRPDPGAFETFIASPVRQLAMRGRHLRIYGELVDLLASEGDFAGARQLEDLWNALGERVSFDLFCGYSTVHFGDPRSAESLRQICHSHFQVRSSPRDVLASFLVNAYRAESARA